MGRRRGNQGSGAGRNTGQTYEQVRQEAARLMADGEAVSFDAARRKAAARLGVVLRQLPSNAEIEQALVDYQRLFRSDSQPQQLRHLRESALAAMTMLADFDPRLVGPVLAGTADRHGPIHLHLFADQPESVAIFLLERQISFEHDERRVRFAADDWHLLPLFRFVAGDDLLELTVFHAGGLRRPPLSPVDNRPMRRANADAVRRLLEEDDQVG